MVKKKQVQPYILRHKKRWNLETFCKNKWKGGDYSNLKLFSRSKVFDDDFDDLK